MSEDVKEKVLPRKLIPIIPVADPKSIKVSIKKKDREKSRPGRPKSAGNNTKVIVPLSTLIAYAKKGLSQREIGAMLEPPVTANTIGSHLRKAGYTMQRLSSYRDNKADIIAIQGMRLIDKISEAQDVDIVNAGDVQKIATAFGILNDHERKERGLATDHILFAHIEQEEKDLVDEIKVIEMEIKEKENN